MKSAIKSHPKGSHPGEVYFPVGIQFLFQSSYCFHHPFVGIRKRSTVVVHVGLYEESVVQEQLRIKPDGTCRGNE